MTDFKEWLFGEVESIHNIVTLQAGILIESSGLLNPRYKTFRFNFWKIVQLHVLVCRHLCLTDIYIQESSMF